MGTWSWTSSRATLDGRVYELGGSNDVHEGIQGIDVTQDGERKP